MKPWARTGGLGFPSTFLLLLLVPAFAALLSGCTTCEPLLEARHRVDVPDGIAVQTWTDADARAFPELDDLLRATPIGDHGHVTWTSARERALWAHYGIDLDQPAKELWFDLDGEVYRVRVLSCDLRGEE